MSDCDSTDINWYLPTRSDTNHTVVVGLDCVS